MKPIPLRVLEFIEFTLSEAHRNTHIDRVTNFVVRIPSSDLLIDPATQKPKIYYNFTVCNDNSVLGHSNKRYRDFEGLYRQLQATFKDCDKQLCAEVPDLPVKVIKAYANELTGKLEDFTNAIL